MRIKYKSLISESIILFFLVFILLFIQVKNLSLKEPLDNTNLGIKYIDSFKSKNLQIIERINQNEFEKISIFKNKKSFEFFKLKFLISNYNDFEKKLFYHNFSNHFVSSFIVKKHYQHDNLIIKIKRDINLSWINLYDKFNSKQVYVFNNIGYDDKYLYFHFNFKLENLNTNYFTINLRTPFKINSMEDIKFVFINNEIPLVNNIEIIKDNINTKPNLNFRLKKKIKLILNEFLNTLSDIYLTIFKFLCLFYFFILIYNYKKNFKNYKFSFIIITLLTFDFFLNLLSLKPHHQIIIPDSFYLIYFVLLYMLFENFKYFVYIFVFFGIIYFNLEIYFNFNTNFYIIIKFYSVILIIKTLNYIYANQKN
jgi:hypothetical protein